MNKGKTRSDILANSLATQIITGVLEVDTVLPPERELADDLNVSRPTLREALRQLEGLGLIVSKAGSGTRVQNWRKTATIDVFPLYLQSKVGTPEFPPLLESSLRVRVAPIMEAVRWLALPHQNVNYLRLRQQMLSVWKFKDSPVDFVVNDFEWMKDLTQTSGYYPALWVMNAFVANYISLVKEVNIAAPPPIDYVDHWNLVFDTCKSGDGDKAAKIVRAYFERHDQALITYLTGAS